MNDAVTQPAPGWYPASMAAAALLRSLGGSTARLLIPQPLAAAPADNGLALTAETDEALLLDPVLVRRNMDGSALEVMVAAETLRAALGIDDDQRPEDTMGLEARLYDTGGPVPFLNAAAHGAFFYLSWFLPLIFLVTLVDSEKRFLHDILSGIIVTRRP